MKIPEAFDAALRTFAPRGEPWDQSNYVINSMRDYGDDWDSNGATAPPAGVVDAALALSAAIRAAGLPCPQCTGAGPNGTVTMEWHQGAEWFEVEVIEPGRAEWSHLTRTEEGTYSGPSCVGFSLD